MSKYATSALLLLACSAVHGYDSFALSYEEVENAWEKYQASFPIGVQTSKTESFASRKSIFIRTHYEITAHNSNRNSTYQMEHNIFSVMNDEEKKNFFGAIPPKPVQETTKKHRTTDDSSIRQLPKIIDFRNNVCMQPVKNQGNCGSCWAFSSTAVVEFRKCIINGTSLALSEQQLVDCDTINAGCNGGWYDDAWKYLASVGGQATAASYPYRGVKGTCTSKTAINGASLSTSSPTKVIGSRDVTTMMTLLSQQRLVSTVVAITNSFLNYASGVYTNSNCGVSNLGYHAVSIVGYGTLSSVDYWVIRNSWGAGWGSAGYVLFQRGTNLCNVEDWASTANVVN